MCHCGLFHNYDWGSHFWMLKITRYISKTQIKNDVRKSVLSAISLNFPRKTNSVAWVWNTLFSKEFLCFIYFILGVLIGFLTTISRSLFQILSLDGGGIRGLVLIQLLLAVEESCRSTNQKLFWLDRRHKHGRHPRTGDSTWWVYWINANMLTLRQNDYQEKLRSLYTVENDFASWWVLKKSN